MTVESNSKSASATGPFGLEWLCFSEGLRGGCRQFDDELARVHGRCVPAQRSLSRPAA